MAIPTGSIESSGFFTRLARFIHRLFRSDLERLDEHLAKEMVHPPQGGRRR